MRGDKKTRRSEITLITDTCCSINQQFQTSNTAMDSDEDGLNSDGTKAEEPKYGISLHKRHKYPGSKGHKATRSKRRKFAVGAPGSVAEEPKRTPIGTTVEEPKVGASLPERYHYPGRKGPERSAPGVVSGVSRGRPAGACLICFLEDKHLTSQCPYLDRVPENAIVSNGCDVVCRRCGYTMKRPGKWICCKREGRAVLKQCEFCLTYGEHWSVECPSDEGVDLARVLLSPIEDLSSYGMTGPLM